MIPLNLRSVRKPPIQAKAYNHAVSIAAQTAMLIPGP